MLGHQAIPESLRQRGLTTVFAMTAETNAPWLGYGVDAGHLQMIRTRHEETAVMEAVGFARSTGKIGVASATRGPGITNSINALAAAVDTHVPLLLIVGEGPRPSAQSQNIDQDGIARLLGAGFESARTAQDWPRALDRALAAAIWKGHPQIVAIHEGVLDGEVSLGRGPMPPRAPQHSQFSTEAVERAGDVLAAAERPLIIAGQGALHSGAGAILEVLAERTGARLGSTLLSVRMFSGRSWTCESTRMPTSRSSWTSGQRGRKRRAPQFRET